MAGANSDEDDFTKIKYKLKVNFKRELGRGLRSTVFEGRFEDIPVAVKRIKCKETEDKKIKELANSRERKIMNQIESERHNNIIGYYVSEIDGEYLYIAMELCQGDLGQYVKRTDLQSSYPAIKVERDIVAGLEFLHSKGIAHRDIKPENIYFVLKQNRISKCVIGDYGTSKVTVEEWFSMSMSIGTTGYISCEVWEETRQMQSDTNFKGRMTRTSDIFSLGCVFYFIESKGQHPFGTPMDRQNNISSKKPPDIKYLPAWQDSLKQLLVMMLSHKPDERPVALEIVSHPALWSANQKLEFLTSLSDALKSADHTMRARFENPDVIWRGNWIINMPVNLASYLESFISNGRHIYTENSSTVYGFLRTIRNVTNHYKSFPKEVQEELGAFPDGHVLLWESLCPRIFMHVYRICSDQKLTDVVYPPEHFSMTNRSQNVTTNMEGRVDEESVSSMTLLKEHPLGTSSNRSSLTGIPPDLSLQSRTDANGNISVTETMKSMSLVSRTRGSDSLPEIVKQPIKYYKADVASWSMSARDEIEMGKQLGFKNIEGKQIVLCLDISESMALGDAWLQVKNFTEDVWKSFTALSTLMDGKQLEYIAISTFGHETGVLQKSTNNVEELRAAFANIKLGGPSPMHGGILLASAAAGALGLLRAKPCVVIISDFKPTETLCFKGPDVVEEGLIEETQLHMLEFLASLKDVTDIVLVPVGDYDQNLVDNMKSWTNGVILSYRDGRQLFSKSLQKGANLSSKDMYKEIEGSHLPAIGSRVERGPDWMWEDQDSHGPGTVIGHDEDKGLWVEWDNNGDRNVYRYGTYRNYDVILIDKGRDFHDSSTLNVGCFVSHHEHGTEKGVVIKRQSNGKFLVRWENGEMAEYSFGQGGDYEIWAWEPLTCTSRTTTTLATVELSVSGNTDIISPKKGKQKNLTPTQKK